MLLRLCFFFSPCCFFFAHKAKKGSRVESVSNGDGGNQISTLCALSLFLKRTTAAFNKHVIRRKTAGCGVADGAVPGIAEEETTRTDGSLFQHLVMHIAQNFIPTLNNQYKQYRCYYFSWAPLPHRLPPSTCTPAGLQFGAFDIQPEHQH